MKQAVIVSAVRTPVGKAPNGALRTTRPDEMGAVVIQEALRRAPGLDPADVDDVIMGCAMPEGEQEPCHFGVARADVASRYSHAFDCRRGCASHAHGMQRPPVNPAVHALG